MKKYYKNSMSTKKTKNILFIPGVLHGHFPGDIEIIKLLVTLGYNVTCYVLDTFAERLKNTGAKIEVFILIEVILINFLQESQKLP